ncbi:MAG: Maf family protein [Pseudobdellovibrionaceae bacterium]|jgi:septum formation protein
MRPLILASQSPRRQQLLKQAGFEFAVLPSKISEIPNKNLNIDEQILDIARQKAKTIFSKLEQENHFPCLILAADTEVVIDNKTLGKPESPDQAFGMLKRLSNDRHEVKTAVVLLLFPEAKMVTHLETTQVLFKNLPDSLIHNYIATGSPFDKAGGYGIQDDAGQDFILKYEGLYSNIIGLPIEKIPELLQQLDVL